MSMLEPAQANDRKESDRLLLFSLLLGALFNLFFWDKEIGISYPIFIAAVYSVLYWSINKRPTLELEFKSLLLITIILLSLSIAIFSNEMLRSLNLLLIPILILAQSLLLVGRNQTAWHNGRFVGEIVLLFGKSLRNMVIPVKRSVLFLRDKSGLSQYSLLLKIGTGILISLPLLFIVIILLSSADSVFGYYVGEIPRKLFEQFTLSEWVFRILQASVIAAFFFGYFWSLTSSEPKSSRQEETKTEASRVAWDATIVITVLTMLTIVYVLFTIIQFSYFFSGAPSELPSGVTYSEYARRGFAELLLVTLINFSILTSVIHRISRNSRIPFLITRGLLGAFTFCTMIMLFSAYYRLSLYESAYGFTHARVLAHSFMIFLFIAILTAFVKVWKEMISLIKSYAVLGLVFYLILNYMNLDALITKNNIARYQETGRIDLYYLERLSYDAVPELVKLKDDPQLSVSIKNILINHKHDLEVNHSWMSYSYSKQRAWNLVKDL